MTDHTSESLTHPKKLSNKNSITHPTTLGWLENLTYLSTIDISKSKGMSHKKF